MEIREGGGASAAEIAALLAAAFPDDDLRPLVAELTAAGAALTLEAREDGALAGHAMLTLCAVTGSEARVGLLGPLAVAPARQGRGIGGALVRAVVEAAGAAGADAVCLLGDPVYYRRFGFAAETRLAPPFPLPPELRPAWQSLGIAGRPSPQGTLAPPAPWLAPELWAPPTA